MTSAVCLHHQPQFSLSPTQEETLCGEGASVITMATRSVTQVKATARRKEGSDWLETAGNLCREDVWVEKKKVEEGDSIAQQ